MEYGFQATIPYNNWFISRSLSSIALVIYLLCLLLSLIHVLYDLYLPKPFDRISSILLNSLWGYRVRQSALEKNQIHILLELVYIFSSSLRPSVHFLVMHESMLIQQRLIQQGYHLAIGDSQQEAGEDDTQQYKKWDT